MLTARLQGAALLIGLTGLLAGCGQVSAMPPAAAAPVAAPVRVAAAALAAPAPCTGAFVAHDLEHVTQSSGPTTRLFDSNGSGLAVNDLDGDGDDDIVLANLSGPVSILWNEGGLRFERTELPVLRRTRGVAAVDVDGDGRLDLAFTHGQAAPAVFRSEGNRAFRLMPLAGVDRPAYAMNWADLEGDGDLDLVTGSYDAARMLETNGNALFSAGAGVNVYRNEDGTWQGTQLADHAQALALALWDLNGDGRADIWVGNDFDDPDQVWFQSGGGWEAAAPFRRFAHSTMSIDRGDLDGDGAGEYFATDMKPYVQDTQTLAAWMPLMQTGYESRVYGDPQRSENMLQVWDGNRFANDAYARRLDALGWAWSAKFGDLDNDGALDLYVVNGMIAADLLGHLPNGELVEENQARRNVEGQFAPAPKWGLGSTRSGRGMSMADLDGDGDLDIVVNNLNAPAQLFENRLCDLGQSLEVDLRWPSSANPFAVGASVTLHTDAGNQLRDVRAVSGYLSGDSARLHFGLPAGAALRSLDIHWPDGRVSQVTDLPSHHRLTVTRLQ